MDDLLELDEVFYILAKEIKYDLTPVQYTAYLQRTKEAKIAIEKLIKARDSKRDAYIIGSDVTQQERHSSDRFGDWCGGQVDTCICDEINALKAEQRRRAGS